MSMDAQGIVHVEKQFVIDFGLPDRRCVIENFLLSWLREKYPLR